MSAILLAVFTDYADAERVRALELMEMQRHAQLMYTSCGWFFDDISGIETVQIIAYAAELAQRVDAGGTSTVAVHPRGDIEILRAVQLLESAGAREVVGHDLQHHSFEHAASRSDGYWVRHFMPENPTGADCIYCRLFPDHAH